MRSPIELRRRRVYQGPRFDIDRVELEARGDGELPVERDAILTPDSVVVLPLMGDFNGDGDATQVVMIRNERYAVGRKLWELCAGTLESGEPVTRCAQRELIEETGYRCGRIEPMLDYYPCPGISTERMYAFLATDLTHVGQQLEPNERIEVEVMPLRRSIEMIRVGEIHDAKTIATLLYYWTFNRKRD